MKDSKDLVIYGTRKSEELKIPKETMFRMVALAYSKIFERVFQGRLENPTAQVRPPWGDEGMAEIEFEFEANILDSDAIALLAEFDSRYGGNFDVDIWSKDTEEYNKEKNDFLKKSDPEAWKEVLKYKYDGTFLVRITYYIEQDEWKKIMKM